MHALHAAVCLLFAGAAMPASADVVTDGSVGSRVRLNGDFEVGAELGARTGRNLFHSFERFSLNAGERATFSGPNRIRNVISRVTGGERSDIDGTLRSTIPGADFYFLNPAGVAFGPNASLDLQGSFHVSTADELRFGNGATFSATNPAASSFTVAAPEAFGFLGAHEPAPILVDRSVLEVATGKAFSLVGGDITIQGDPDAPNPGGPGTARAGAGTLTLAGTAGPGHLAIASGTLSADRQADVTLRNQAQADVSGDGGGIIRIRGGSLVVEERSFVFADNEGATDSQGGVDVRARAVAIVGGSVLSADAFGSGAAGMVAIRAREVQIRNNGIVQSLSRGEGNGGIVTVIATDQLIIDGTGADLDRLTGIASQSERGATGKAGRVVVRAGAIFVRDHGAISSNTLVGGNAGTVTVTATNLHIRNGSVISSGTFGRSDAGTVTVVVADRLIINPAGGTFTGITSQATPSSTGGDAGAVVVTAGTLTSRGGEISSSTFGPGDAGTVRVTADRLRVLAGGQIASGTFGDRTGAAGEVVVTARDALLISGRNVLGFPSGIRASAEGAADNDQDAGSVTITAGALAVRDGGRISSSTLTAGDAGNVTVSGDRLTLLDGGQISSSALGESTGGGGKVRVTASGTLLIAGEGGGFPSGIFASAEGAPASDKGAGNLTVKTGEFVIRDTGLLSSATNAAGNAGTVTVEADRIEFVDDGRIFNGTNGAGNGGDIVVRARIIFADASSNPTTNHTGISASANPTSSGDGGDVVVRANRIVLINGAEISSDSDSSGDAGTVTVSAGQLELRAGGQIFTTSSSTGDAGSIAVFADRLEMDAGRITTDTASAGGGEVQLVVNDVVDLRNSAVTTSVAGGDSSTAGNISIDPKVLVIDGSRIQANAPAGFGGMVTIVADNILVPGGDFEALLAREEISATGGDPTRAGSVVVSAPEVDLAGGLVVLEGALLDAASQLRERCGARRDIGASSFTGVGRGGLPPTPDGPLSGAYLAAAPSGGGGLEGRAAAADYPSPAAAPCLGAP